MSPKGMCQQNWNLAKKNPAYGRHWISHRLQIVVPMQNGGKRLKIVREKKVQNGKKKVEIFFF